MSSIPSFLRFAQADLSLRGARQNLIATNLANIDTPNFKARDINFARSLQTVLAGERTAATPLYLTSAPVRLDGNDVSPTREKLESLQNVGAMNKEVVFLHQSTTDMLTALRPNPNGV